MVAIAEEQEQLKAQLEDTQTKLQDAERERDKTKSELHDIREELERTQSQLDEVLGELEQTHFELHQLKEKPPEEPKPEIDASVKEELEKTKSQLQSSQAEEGKVKSQLHDLREELERTQSQLDEVLGELEQTHFELHQLKDKPPEEPKPEIDASVKEELEKTKSQLQTFQAELGKTQSEFQDTKEELERTYSQLDQIMGELEQSNFELHQLKEKTVSVNKEELEKSQVEVQRFQTKLQKVRDLLQEKEGELQQTKAAYASHVTKSLVNVILPTISEERLDVKLGLRGSLQQRKRLALVAEYCIKGWGGDLIEIGCFHGETTGKLAEVAKKYDRRIIALWKIENQNSQIDDYDTFLKNIEPYKDVVDIIRLSSLDEGAIAMVKNRELCFAFVDGLHTYDACLKDIETVAHCQGIIAVDDLLWSADVEGAFQKGAEVIGRSKLHLPICREGYLLPSA